VYWFIIPFSGFYFIFLYALFQLVWHRCPFPSLPFSPGGTSSLLPRFLFLISYSKEGIEDKTKNKKQLTVFLSVGRQVGREGAFSSLLYLIHPFSFLDIFFFYILPFVFSGSGAFFPFFLGFLLLFFFFFFWSFLLLESILDWIGFGYWVKFNFG
jgi:hypothetical protein